MIIIIFKYIITRRPLWGVDECIIDIYYLYDNNFDNMFKRAFKYTYKIEEKQLRDRLLIQK